MVDQRGTLTVDLLGGVIETIPPILQGSNNPGSLLKGQNFEPATIGGYRRISGFTKYDDVEVTGTGKVLGCFVFNSGVLACRATTISFGSGAGWVTKHTQPATPSEYLAERYNWVEKSIILVDGVNLPIRYKEDDTITTLTAAPQGAVDVAEYSNHMWFIKDSILYSSEPNDETSYSTAAGAVVINTGRDKTALAVWRDSLYILGPNSVHKLTGSSEIDFTLEVVTEDLGTISPRSIQEISGDVWFLAYDGMRTIAGTEKNDDLALGLLTRHIPDIMERLPFRSSSKDVVSLHISKKEQFRLFVGDPTATTQDLSRSIEGVLSGTRVVEGREVMEWFTTKGINPSCCDALVESIEEVVIHGGYDGFIYEQESGPSFDGSKVNAITRMPYWTFGDNNVRKTLYSLGVYIESEGTCEASVSYQYDYLISGILQPASIALSSGSAGVARYGTGIYGTATYFTEYPIKADQYLVGSGKNVSFEISSDDINEPYTVQTLSIEYSLAGRR